MIRRPPRSTPRSSSAASDVYKRQVLSDLQKLYDNMKNNSKIVCDDFAGITKIESVEKAIKDFAKNNKIKLEEKFKRFALLNVEK